MQVMPLSDVVPLIDINALGNHAFGCRDGKWSVRKKLVLPKSTISTFTSVLADPSHHIAIILSRPGIPPLL
jgi:hypothetical protein